MSDHDDHDHDCQPGPGDGHGGGQSGRGSGGPNTDFLDFELDKVMYEEAEGIVREAYRELLKDAAKRRLAERWGARITALANLAVDEAMADTEANLQIQAMIEARNAARRGLEDRVQAIIAGGESGESRDESGEAEPEL